MSAHFPRVINLHSLILCLGFVLITLDTSGENEPVSTRSAVITPIVITSWFTPASLAPDGIEYITIPLKRIGHLFLIEARIDNESGNFVFDTGSSRLVLNKTYFRKYIVVDDETGGGITGSTEGVGRTSVRSLEMSGMRFTNLSADVTSLAHIENRRGVKILGLMGLSLLQEMEIVIDLNNNVLHLYKIDRKGNRIGGSGNRKFDLTQRIESYRNIILVKAVIGGKVLDFCLDTGAETNVLNSRSSKPVMSTVTIQRRSDLVGVSAGQSDVLYGTLTDFNIAGMHFPSMKTIIANMDRMSKSYGRVIDGMLGFDFFSQGVICINLIKNEMGIYFAKTEEKRKG
ncbi:MAG TPA: pepsin/retropepsin-like aspartic protease family protein [Bacteroidales bacterium]|nr:pepsin/retropepsin-like aspartic protease family protein [Bacteroidales bacterium]HPT09288.1 pepsin/retropepsin-like aspartic protease family protein [Bacteroidales bacterium]